jgi:hypothetical protein
MEVTTTSFLESLGCVVDSLHCELKGRGGVIGPLHHEPRSTLRSVPKFDMTNAMTMKAQKIASAAILTAGVVSGSLKLTQISTA